MFGGLHRSTFDILLHHDLTAPGTLGNCEVHNLAVRCPIMLRKGKAKSVPCKCIEAIPEYYP